MELDKIIHEPVRLRIMMVLAGVAEADFNFLLTTLELTRGNLSRHVEKLESAGYVEVKKTFVGRMPNTSYIITKDGKRALGQYWKSIDEVRRLGG
ncbi:MAG TPA: transcriptional regulator [Sedimentisphaerales bacterium]|nr:transcriptional regulator [Sedimentisphaerales bacterium]